jgi:hypothetical protein
MTTATHQPTAPAVDRYLCSYAHLSPDFASYVLSEFVEPSLDALGPSFGIDLVALVQHATMARRRIVRLRVLLAGDLGLLVLSLLVVIAITGTTGTAAAVLAAAGTSGLLIGVVFPFSAVLITLFQVHDCVQRINAGTVSPRDCAPPLSAALAQRLDAQMAANVVVFEGGNPFVGCGLSLGSWKLRVDTTKAAKDSTGNPRQLHPVSAMELHKELTKTVRQAGIVDLRVHNRLFVGGTAASKVPGLLPDQYGRPAAQVSPAALRLGIEKPRPDARTYMCVEKISWNGELVVSLFVRAAMHGEDLFVEGHTFWGPGGTTGGRLPGGVSSAGSHSTAAPGSASVIWPRTRSGSISSRMRTRK